MSDTTVDIPADDVPTGRLTRNQRHRILASARRRAALDVLAGCDDTIDLDTLAAETEAVLEPDGGTGSLRSKLHHCDLPLLDDVGIVSYDPDCRRVAPRSTSIASLIH